MQVLNLSWNSFSFLTSPRTRTRRCQIPGNHLELGHIEGGAQQGEFKKEELTLPTSTSANTL
jgi:hypothetical protein